ncbi:eukaryotic translation initiation factor 1 isoform X1 [Trichomycterus rosablanca]|uniref:eukaryotic translation initiation factor 1 isoform X1 n=1 Tax=Trichomycterus rosablanca TaxID=2290929 RepID=UPI002F3536D2
MSAIQNLQTFDPFADATKGDDQLPAGTEDYIHIRIQQRNGRKTLTTVQGIADDYDKKKLVKAFKKKFACNGTVVEHPEYGEVIQLQGDQRKNICQFLTEVQQHDRTTIRPIRVEFRLNWPKRSSSKSTVSK